MSPNTTLTLEEIDAFDLYDYWDNAGPDDQAIPCDELVRAVLTAQGFYQ